MSTSEPTFTFDHAMQKVSNHTDLSNYQAALIAADFEDRYDNGPEGDGSVSDEWTLYVRDIGGYGNFLSYVRCLAVHDTDQAAMLAAYIDCALWSSHEYDEDGNTGSALDEDYSADDLAPDAVASMRADVVAFATENADDLTGMSPEQAGHDFWLTRNGHGAGFWDRGLGEAGDRLTAACRPYGSSDLYIGDDGLVYVA